MRPMAEAVPIGAGMAKRCWQPLPCSALGARASQKQTGKVPRQGERKHLTPYLINSNRHINSLMSTCAVIGNPPVNMLARPNLEVPCRGKEAGCVWERTVSLGAADGLGAGAAGTKLWSRVLALQGHHRSIGGTCHMQSHLLCQMGLQQPLHLLWALHVFTPVQDLYTGLELHLRWLPVTGNAADLCCACHGLEEKVVSNK